jgi:hypothetical protein
MAAVAEAVAGAERRVAPDRASGDTYRQAAGRAGADGPQKLDRSLERNPAWPTDTDVADRHPPARVSLPECGFRVGATQAVARASSSCSVRSHLKGQYSGRTSAGDNHHNSQQSHLELEQSRRSARHNSSNRARRPSRGSTVGPRRALDPTRAGSLHARPPRGTPEACLWLLDRALTGSSPDATNVERPHPRTLPGSRTGHTFTPGYCHGNLGQRSSGHQSGDLRHDDLVISR